ncbi:MAG TPA: glycosyltransferase [Acetobacteraceae bacterium]|nr:glycosyltransferase [Acetobacteraceae bacterium]
MAFMSYAPNYEDVMLHRAFKDVKAGFYIDVVAGNPYTDSVTRAFYDRGWRGINIEPHPDRFVHLSAARRRDLNMQVAVGADEGHAALVEGADGCLGGQGGAFDPQHSGIDHTFIERTVPQTALREICRLHAPPEVHFLRIGTGGCEGSVLAGADFEACRPHVVLVNATGKLTAAESPDWESILIGARYQFVWFDGSNRYYVAEEHRETLGRHFLAPPNARDQFLCAGEVVALRASGVVSSDPAVQMAESEARVVRAERRAAAERAARVSAEMRAGRAELAGLAALTEIAALRASKSWRMTAPLRRLSWALQRSGRATESGGSGAATDLAAIRRRTLYVECTHTYFSDVNTGIQRVVRNVLRYAPEIADRFGFDVVPIIVDGGRFVTADVSVVLADKQRQLLERLQHEPTVPDEEQMAQPMVRLRRRLLRFGRPAWRASIWALARLLPFESVKQFLYAPPSRFGLAGCIVFPWRFARSGFRLERRIQSQMSPDLDQQSLSAADALLLLDSSWHLPVWPAVQRFRSRGGMVIGVAYDLIPISHPDACVPELVACFDQWLNLIASEADAFVTISRSTAKALKEFLAHENRCGRRLPPVAHFYLGSELDFHSGEHEVRPAIKGVFDTNEHVYLMVGSIEPRKKHAFVLEAFDRYWSAGGKGRLVIIGRQGWRTEDVLERIASHPEHEKRLHLVRDATDSELDHAYRNASALIIASEIEGFGLPVVEAFQRGLPVLCSDIPVFREIAEGRATFFSLEDPDCLVYAIREFTLAHDATKRQERNPVAWLSWRESTEQLFAAMAPFLGCVPEMEDEAERVPVLSAAD